MTSSDEPVTEVVSLPDDTLLAQLYRREHDGLVRLAHLITGSNLAAQDLVQDSFLVVRDRFSSLENPRAYLRTTVVNRCRGWLRHRGVEERHVSAAGQEPIVLAPELDETWHALARLNERQRTALVLRYYADLPIDEIAEVMECPAGTVKSLVHRGLAALKEVLEP